MNNKNLLTYLIKCRSLTCPGTTEKPFLKNGIVLAGFSRDDSPFLKHSNRVSPVIFML
jgi:hypothetical protein